MSYHPGPENYSEFIAAWNTSDQTSGIPTKISGNETTANFTFNLQGIKKNGEASLASNQVSTGTNPAFWTGDIRSYAGSTSFNMFTIELENNELTRSAALQDQRIGFGDDMCYSLTDEAILKMKILYRCGGTSYGAAMISPYVRVIGVLVEQ